MKHTVELLDTSTLDVKRVEIETEDSDDFFVRVEELRDSQAEADNTDYLVNDVTRGGLDG